jgi:hypothetical protein
MNTKSAREFAEGGDRYTGAEVRLWVHGLCDALDAAQTEAARLRAICVAAHDRLLRGGTDAELLALLESAWKPASPPSQQPAPMPASALTTPQG